MGALIVSQSAHQTRTELMVVRFRLRRCRRKTDGMSEGLLSQCGRAKRCRVPGDKTRIESNSSQVRVSDKVNRKKSCQQRSVPYAACWFASRFVLMIPLPQPRAAKARPDACRFQGWSGALSGRS